MSSFVLNRNYQLQLPNSFVEVDRAEMEYVDGGFSMYVLSDNIRGLMGTSRAFAGAFGGVALSYSWSYWTATSIIGGKLAAGAVWYLGTYRKFY